MLPIALALRSSRFGAAWAALRGRPVAYRVAIEGGGLTLSNSTGAVIVGCMFTGLPTAVEVAPEEPAP
jgi:hypothetical protein